MNQVCVYLSTGLLKYFTALSRGGISTAAEPTDARPANRGMKIGVAHWTWGSPEVRLGGFCPLPRFR